MDPIGPAIAASLAGLNQAEKQAARDAKKAGPTDTADRFRRALDEAELTIAETESESAVRGVKGNEEEDARQDHKQHGSYGSGGAEPGAAPDADTPPTLDLNA